MSARRKSIVKSVDNIRSVSLFKNRVALVEALSWSCSLSFSRLTICSVKPRRCATSWKRPAATPDTSREAMPETVVRYGSLMLDYNAKDGLDIWKEVEIRDYAWQMKGSIVPYLLLSLIPVQAYPQLAKLIQAHQQISGTASVGVCRLACLLNHTTSNDVGKVTCTPRTWEVAEARLTPPPGSH